MMNWNVQGFGLEPEQGTMVTINLQSEKSFCILHVNHEKIKQAASAKAKEKAWKEILDDLETKPKSC